MIRHTVLIVNWNSWELLSRCLRKLAAQTFKDFGIVVIDNASEQPEPEGLITQYPNVTLIRAETNIGFAAANNRAIESLVNTEWVALVNPDAFPEPEWLESLQDAAKLNPGVVAFGSRQLCDDDLDLLDGKGDSYHISGLAWRDAHKQRQSQGDLVPKEIFSPCAAGALYLRQALIDVGAFDEDFFCYLEDVDLGFRLRLAGHKAMYVPNAVVRHVGSATTGGQQSDFSIYHGHRNLVWTYVKDMPGVLFWLFLPMHLLMNLVSVLWLASKGRGAVILRAKRDAIAGLPRMWKKRTSIQSCRRASVFDVWRVLDKRIARRPQRHQAAIEGQEEQ